MGALKELLLPPTEEDIGQAREAEKELRQAFALLDRPEPASICLRTDGEGVRVTLPGPVLHLVMEILHLMAEGKAVALFPYHMELTTQQAADLLNVSRPFLVGLCDSGQIPYTRPGRHRRVRLHDLLDYKRKHEERREQLLTDLVEAAQEMELGY